MMFEQVKKWAYGALSVMGVTLACSHDAAALCTLSVNTAGVLGLSVEGDTLGSQELGGAPSVMAIVSVGRNRVTVESPSGGAAGELADKPQGYSGNPSVSIGYIGVSGLGGVSQGYTTVPSSFSTGLVPTSVLNLHAKIEDPNGFSSGTYRARTMVTCAPD